MKLKDTTDKPVPTEAISPAQHSTYGEASVSIIGQARDVMGEFYTTANKDLSPESIEVFNKLGQTLNNLIDSHRSIDRDLSKSRQECREAMEAKEVLEIRESIYLDSMARITDKHIEALLALKRTNHQCSTAEDRAYSAEARVTMRNYQITQINQERRNIAALYDWQSERIEKFSEELYNTIYSNNISDAYIITRIDQLMSQFFLTPVTDSPVTDSPVADAPIPYVDNPTATDKVEPDYTKASV